MRSPGRRRLSLGGLAFLALALVTTVHDCTISLGCDAETQPSLPDSFIVLASVALVLFAAGAVLGAYLSGQPSTGAAAARAVGASYVAMAVGSAALDSIGVLWLAAIVPALTVQAALAIRSPSGRVLYARLLIALGTLILLALAPATWILLAFIAIPGLGAADALATAVGGEGA